MYNNWHNTPILWEVIKLYRHTSSLVTIESLVSSTFSPSSTAKAGKLITVSKAASISYRNKIYSLWNHDSFSFWGGNFQWLLKSKKLSKVEILFTENSLNWTLVQLHVQFIYKIWIRETTKWENQFEFCFMLYIKVQRFLLLSLILWVA